MKIVIAVALTICLLLSCTLAEGAFPFGLDGMESYFDAVEKLEIIWGTMDGNDEESEVYDYVLDEYVTVFAGRSIEPKNTFFFSLLSFSEVATELFRNSLSLVRFLSCEEFYVYFITVAQLRQF